MIISASRRTDIPAFYGEWFMRRIRAGFCLVPNPYNAQCVTRVSLEPEDVDAIVFWTKNPAPFIPSLSELEQKGYNYYFLYTLNDYPPSIEPHVPSLEERMCSFTALSELLGPERVLWRYDPIILSDHITPEKHMQAFSRLSAQLDGRTERVIISFVDFYKKTERRLAQLEVETGDCFWRTFSQTANAVDLLSGLHATASAHGMELTSCAENMAALVPEIKAGKCVDDSLLFRLFGTSSSFKKDLGQRPDCRCVVSRDIGISNSCRHGCVYCYATLSRQSAQRNAVRHTPDGEALFSSSE